MKLFFLAEREETERDSLFEALGFFKGEGKGEKGVEVERRKKSPTLKNSFPKQKQKTSKPFFKQQKRRITNK